jgi:hypothetical protein
MITVTRSRSRTIYFSNISKLQSLSHGHGHGHSHGHGQGILIFATYSCLHHSFLQQKKLIRICSSGDRGTHAPSRNVRSCLPFWKRAVFEQCWNTGVPWQFLTWECQGNLLARDCTGMHERLKLRSIVLYSPWAATGRTSRYHMGAWLENR